MPKCTRCSAVPPVCYVPRSCDICRRNKKRTNNHLRPDYHPVPRNVPTFRDGKGLKVSICQFTANPPTKHGGIPAPKKDMMKSCQEKDRVLKPKKGIIQFVEAF